MSLQFIYLAFFFFSLKTCIENYENFLLINLSISSAILTFFLAIIEFYSQMNIEPNHIIYVKGIFTQLLSALILECNLLLPSNYQQILLFYIFHLQYVFFKKYKGFNYRLCFALYQIFSITIFVLFLINSFNSWIDWLFIFGQQPILHFLIDKKKAQKDLSKSNILLNGPSITLRPQSFIQTPSQPDQQILSLGLLKEIFDIFPMGFIILDAQSNIITCNNKVSKYIETDDFALIRQTLNDLMIEGYINNNTNDLRQRNKTVTNRKHSNDIIKFKQGSQMNYDSGRKSIDEVINISPVDHGLFGRRTTIVQTAKVILRENIDYLNPKKSEIQKCRNLKVQHKNRLLSIRIFEISLPNNKQKKEKHILILIENYTDKENFRQFNQKHQFESLLLNSFSHELRTPINCSLQLQLLLSAKINPILFDQFLRPSIINIQKLNHQVNDILDYASLEANNFQLKLSTFELSEIFSVIQDYYELECKQKGIQLRFEVQECEINTIINNDKDRIIQILVNLMNNAVKFSNEKGEIICKVSKIKSNFQFSLKDNGVGIVLERLIKIKAILGQQGKKIQDLDIEYEQYVGLGLKISNRIASFLKSKGHLEIRSIQNESTQACFFVKNFPIQRGKNLSIYQEPPAQLIKIERQIFFEQKSRSLKCACKKVLICDDIPFNHIALESILKSFSIQVDNAYDGYQAIQKVKRMKENVCPFNCQYNLIFMDIEMPGIDGFETTKQILEIDCNLNIVMCSAYDSKNNIEEGLKCGMKEIVGKPIQLQHLKKILMKFNLLG